MFSWLRRRKAEAPPAPRKRARPAVQRSNEAEAPPPGPAALPEVVAEGNTEAEWSAWEDSMTALDSQLPGLVPGDRVYVKDTRPSQLDDLDPFSGVARKR